MNKDLVNNAAIDAALKARWQTGTDWLHGKDETPDTALRNQLEAAAPFIAAEALRQAAEKFREYPFDPLMLHNEGMYVRPEYLLHRMADELEGK